MDGIKLKITLKQQRFVDGYIISGNGTYAVRKAGYKVATKATASAIAYENLRKPQILEAIRIRKKELIQDKVTPEYVLNGMLQITNADPADMYDINGNLKHIKDMPKNIRMALKAFDVERRSIGNEENFKTTTQKIKLESKLGAYQWLGMVLNMVKSKKKDTLDEKVLKKMNDIQVEAEELAMKFCKKK